MGPRLGGDDYVGGVFELEYPGQLCAFAGMTGKLIPLKKTTQRLNTE